MRRHGRLVVLAIALCALGCLGSAGMAGAEASSPGELGAWKGKTKQGFPVYFRVTSEGVTNVRFTYRESICGKQSPHDPTTTLGIDEAAHFAGAIYSGRLEFEGTFLSPTQVKGKLIALETTGLPGCLRQVVGFTASPR